MCVHACVCMYIYVFTTTYLRVEAQDDERVHTYFCGFGVFGIQVLTYYLSKVS